MVGYVVELGHWAQYELGCGCEIWRNAGAGW